MSHKTKPSILIVTAHFFPESFRINDVAWDWVQKGYAVTVLTGQPNYPDPAMFAAYRKKKIWKENIHGVTVLRVPLITRGSGGGIRRILNYASFVISATVLGLPRLLNKKFDVIFVWASSPITAAIPAIFYKFIKKISLIIWIQDLWPETLRAVGVVKSEAAFNAVGGLVRWIYKHCDCILAQSEGFYQSIRKWAPTNAVLFYLPNWGDETLPSQEIPSLPQVPELKILFAGNLGKAQNLSQVLKIAEASKHLPVKWFFVGEGSEKENLQNEILQKNLVNSVTIWPRVSSAEIIHYGQWADLLLVSLANDDVFNLTIPSKVQTYMFWGKPILAIATGETAKVVENAKCGLWQSPECVKETCSLIENVIHEPETYLTSYGRNSRIYYDENFLKENVLGKLEDIVKKLL